MFDSAGSKGKKAGTGASHRQRLRFVIVGARFFNGCSVCFSKSSSMHIISVFNVQSTCLCEQIQKVVLFIDKMDKECPPPVSVSRNSANWPHTESAARTVLIGRSRIQIAFVVLQEGSGLFCQRATVISSGDGGRGQRKVLSS